jgi:hypothetical protein
LKNDKDVIKALINTQKEIGKQPENDNQIANESNTDQAFVLPEVETIPSPDKLPPIPEDDPKVKEAINAQLAKRLKDKYPDMPTDFDSVEHKEWLRDLQDDDPRASLKFVQDFDATENQVKADAKEAFYISGNFKKINNSVVEGEVKLLQAELAKYGITDPKKELGIDLTLEKDAGGVYFNETLNTILLQNQDAVERKYGFPILKRSIKREDGSIQHSPLVNSFLVNNISKILNHYTKSAASQKMAATEKLKAENLNTLGSENTSGRSTKAISVEEIEQLTDPSSIARAKQELIDSL